MSEITRRGLLGMAGAGAAVLAAGGLAGCSSDDSPTGADAPGSAPTGESRLFAFRGLHQAGVTAPPSAAGIVVALDSRADDRTELAESFRKLSDAIEHVMSGDPYTVREPGFPPVDTGIVPPGPTGTTVVVGYGDSLFDDRFGLGDRRPIELQPMPKFANDFLVRPKGSHGDLAITIGADSGEAAIHAMRQILRETRGDFVPRWTRDGFNHIRPDFGPGEAPGRNLLGFLDGSANLDTSDDELMDAQVWVRDGDGQPDWALGGTYQAVRVIRMMVEFWDRTRLSEQEAIFGRSRATGAPLGLEAESDTPVFGNDLTSHIARANPRTPGSERNLILRRGFNYAAGLDENDQLDQGLLFMSFQRSLENGFIAVQRRLDGEALEEYIRPVGGGFYFVPPPPSDGEYLGERLLA